MVPWRAHRQRNASIEPQGRDHHAGECGDRSDHAARRFHHPQGWTSTRRKVVDRVVLDADDRQRRRIVLTGEKARKCCSISQAGGLARRRRSYSSMTASIMQVAGQPERLLEIVPSIAARFRAAGLASRQPSHRRADRRRTYPYSLRSCAGRDVARIGAKVTALDAAFDPEAGAPQGAHHHGHSHG